MSSITAMLRHNWHQLWIALDQVGNVLVSCAFGEDAWADETLSAHAWRWHLEGVRDWPYRLIDVMLFWQKGHCRSAYESEVGGLQLPEQERRKNVGSL